MFLYLLVPGFWTAIEERDRPTLRSRPLIMGSLSSQGAVREVNALAGRYGIRPGMSFAQAHQLCPDGVFLTPDLPRYEGSWEEICAIVRDYTPLVEPLEIGRLICDLTGCALPMRDRIPLLSPHPPTPSPVPGEGGTAMNGSVSGGIPGAGDANLPAPVGTAALSLSAPATTATHSPSGSPSSPSTTTAGLLTLATTIHRRIHERVGVDPSIGMASNRLVAELASTTVGADGITIIQQGQERAFLADLPITLLPEIDPRLALTFSALGLRTIGQLAALPAAAVSARFGAAGRQLHRYARGEDSRPVVPLPVRPAVSARQECDDGSGEEALERLHDLAARCAAELQERDLAGRLIVLHLHWADGPAHTMLPVSRLPTRAAELPSPPTTAPLPAEQRTRSSREMIAVREPLSSTEALFDKARALLLQAWQQLAPAGDEPPRLASLELTVTEFAEPIQLAFDGMERLDATGSLGGSLSVRRRLIAEQDRILTARHGTEPFRHVTQVDPSSILTERRFRWRSGLSWTIAPERKRSARRRS